MCCVNGWLRSCCIFKQAVTLPWRIEYIKFSFELDHAQSPLFDLGVKLV
jgi:hypothetical protein